MDFMEILALVSVAMGVSFFAGVFLHKYAVSEAEAIKQHVSAEISALRKDLTEVSDKTRQVLRDGVNRL